MTLADAYRYAAEVMTENMMARDAEEGIGAFIEKREPKWQDQVDARHRERAAQAASRSDAVQSRPDGSRSRFRAPRNDGSDG